MSRRTNRQRTGGRSGARRGRAGGPAGAGATVAVCALVVASCGGTSNGRVTGDVTPPTTGTVAETSDGRSQPSATTGLGMPTGIPTPTTTPTTAPTTAPTPTTPPSEFTARDTVIDVTMPQTPPEVEPAATFEEHLSSMYAAFAELVTGNQQWADQLSGDTFTVELATVAPDVAIDITLASAAAYVAGAQLLETYAKAGTGAGYSAPADEYFARQSRYAAALTDLGQGMFEVFEPTRRASFSTQSCVMIALFEGVESCDFDDEGRRVVADIELLFESAEELDALDALDDLAPPLTSGELCEAWDRAVPGGVPAEVDLLLIQSAFEVQFLHRTECLVDVDAQDLANRLFGTSTTALRNVYDDVIAVGGDLAYDEEFSASEPDMAPSDYRLGEYTAMLALFSAIRDSGLRERSTVFEPLGRAAMLSFGVIGGLEVPYWQYLIDNDMDDSDLIPLARACFDDSLNTVESCDPDVAPFARLVGFSDNHQTLIAEAIVDWELEISHSLDHCQIWADALDATDVASQDRVAFQVSQLGLDVVLGLQDC